MLLQSSRKSARVNTDLSVLSEFMMQLIVGAVQTSS